MAARPSPETLRRLAWFVGLWAAGVAVVLTIGAILRAVLL
jgi:hypothetical protein